MKVKIKEIEIYHIVQPVSLVQMIKEQHTTWFLHITVVLYFLYNVLAVSNEDESTKYIKWTIKTLGLQFEHQIWSPETIVAWRM